MHSAAWEDVMRARVALEDGTVLTGRAIGARGSTGGEVVFTTAMTGYEEVLSDPSYRGQIVTMAYPLIGNYGVSGDAWESYQPHVAGFIVGEAADLPHHWRADRTLASALAQWGVVGVADVDTRRLVRHLRTHGLKRGVISTDELSDEALVERARALPDIGTLDLVAQVSARTVEHHPGPGPRVAVLDCGVKRGIVQNLQRRGCDVWVSPGPGDPKNLSHQVEQVRRLWDRLPIFGICLGHQIIGRAAGAETFKLPYGHRGSNHPVRDLDTGRVYVTTQNHGYAVDEASLDPSELVVTHRNLNDGTVEGLRHPRLPIVSVQYHPEGRPGPHDSGYLFDQWTAMLGARETRQAVGPRAGRREPVDGLLRYP
jgi:carbamoyl-phosphate synthase small subunit